MTIKVGTFLGPTVSAVAIDPARVRRVVVNRIAELLLLVVDEGSYADFYRANHECMCPACGEAYWRHAVDPFERYLHVLCNGDRVKL
jgi:hypothetical protein